jgi:hypothetical protein
VNRELPEFLEGNLSDKQSCQNLVADVFPAKNIDETFLKGWAFL